MENIAENVCETDSIFERTKWSRFSGAVSLFRDFVFAFALGVWVSVTVYRSVTSGAVSPNWLFFILGIVLFLVFANCFLLQMKYYFLKVHKRGIRSLEFFKGMIDTPWERVGFIEVDGKGRWSVVTGGGDHELGELNFGDYKYPEQLAKFMMSQYELAGDKIEIVEPKDEYDTDGSRPEAVPRKVQRLAHLIGIGHGVGIFVFVGLCFGPEFENKIWNLASMGCALLLSFSWSYVSILFKKKWPKIKLLRY